MPRSEPTRPRKLQYINGAQAVPKNQISMNNEGPKRRGVAEFDGVRPQREQGSLQLRIFHSFCAFRTRREQAFWRPIDMANPRYRPQILPSRGYRGMLQIRVAAERRTRCGRTPQGSATPLLPSHPKPFILGSSARPEPRNYGSFYRGAAAQTVAPEPCLHDSFQTVGCISLTFRKAA